MNITSWLRKNWVLVGAVLIIIIVAITYSSRPERLYENGDAYPYSEENGDALPQGAEGEQPRYGGAPPVAAPVPSGAIRVVMPAAGEIWSSEKSHTIRWSREAGYSGGIALLDASSKAVIGWIVQNFSSDQVTYNWDTMGVALTRTNPVKTDVPVGTYVVRIVFDGAAGAVESAPFSIMPGDEERILTHEVSIRDRAFSPRVISLVRGEQAVIVNKENIGTTQTLTMGGARVATLAAKSSYVFGPQIPSGTYVFGLEGHPLAELTVRVE